MRRLSCCLVTVVLCATQGACAADYENASVELADLMPKIFLAYGGREALAQLDKNYILIGEQTQFDADGKPTIVHYRQVRKGADLRIDVEPGGEAPSVSTVYDGMSAWKAIGKVVEDLPEDQAKILKKERDHQPSVLSHFGEAPYIFRLAGRTVYRAAPAYALEVGRDGEEAETVFIDEKNYQVLGMSYRITSADVRTPATVNIDYSQYRPSSGGLFPFKQTQSVNDKPSVELAINSVDTGSDIDDQQFRRPDRPSEVRLSKPNVVPFDYSHKEILVKVRVNDGEPLDFLFDSAASQTVIDRRTAAESFLDKQGQFTVSAVGGQVPTQMTTIKKLALGDTDLTDVSALILDLMPQTRQMGKRIAGIIGANVLNKFAVTIDFSKSQVVLNDASTYKPPPTAALVPFANKQGPTIKASLNGTTAATFLIDTGAAFNNLPSSVAKVFIVGQPSHTTEGTGLDGKPVRLATLVLNTVKIGTQSIRAVNFTYSVDQDVAGLPNNGVPFNNVGVLGNPFWQNFIITFDYKFQRLVLQPNTVVTSRQEVDSLITTGDTKLIIHRDLRAAEAAYEKALMRVQALGDPKLQARVWGRIGNLRRVMAKDLNRPEQARVAYEYFSKAQELAHKLQDRDTEGRVLADWSLLYLDNGQIQAAQQALQGATLYSPQDAQVMVDFAVYLYKMQQYPDMQKYIEKALFLDPSNWQGLWYKIKLAEMFADTEQLKSTLKEVIKFYPWSRLAKDKLAAVTAPPVLPGQSPLPGGLPNGSLPPSVGTPAGINGTYAAPVKTGPSPSTTSSTPRTPVSTFAPR